VGVEREENPTGRCRFVRKYVLRVLLLNIRTCLI